MPHSPAIIINVSIISLKPHELLPLWKVEEVHGSHMAPHGPLEEHFKSNGEDQTKTGQQQEEGSPGLSVSLLKREAEGNRLV